MTKPGEKGPAESPPSANRVTARGQRKREQIIEVATRHFARSGFRGASTAAIAAEVGISDPGLLHHFQSKIGLLLAVLEDRYGHDDRTLGIPPGSAPQALLERLQEIVEENAGSRESVLLYSVLLAESISEDEPSHDYFKTRFRQVRRILRDELDDARSVNLLRADVDTGGLAAVLVAVLDGLQFQWLIDPDFDMSAAFAALAPLLSLAPEASPTRNTPRT